MNSEKIYKKHKFKEGKDEFSCVSLRKVNWHYFSIRGFKDNGGLSSVLAKTDFNTCKDGLSRFAFRTNEIHCPKNSKGWFVEIIVRWPTNLYEQTI